MFGISEKDIQERGIALRGKAVIQKDLNDKILKIYPTASEAGRQLGLKSWSQISNCCTEDEKLHMVINGNITSKEKILNGIY